jgi:hypothetical protein
MINKVANGQRLALLSSSNTTIDIVNPKDQLETRRVKVEKKISDIEFVLSLMMKHKATTVPKDELDNITDVDILLLCEFDKASLLNQLIEKQTILTDLIAMERQAKLASTTTQSRKLISVLILNSYVIMLFCSCDYRLFEMGSKHREIF